MKIEDIEAFVEVIRMQSISQAAQQLGMTQPAITRRIQNLEAALGAELLDRSTKPPRANELGQRVLDACRTVLHDIEALRTMAAAPRAAPARLRLGVTQGLADAAIGSALPALRKSFPELDVQLSTAWGQTLLKQVEAGELDAAVAWIELPRSSPKAVQVQPLGRSELRVVAAPGTQDALQKRLKRRRLHVADLAGEAWVLNPDGCGFREGLRRAFAAQGLALKLRLDTFGQDTQLALVAQGHGLGLVPTPLLQRSPHRAGLETLTLADFKPTLELWAMRGPAGVASAASVDLFAARIAASMTLPRPARAPVGSSAKLRSA